ncbi:MAG: hypothetical protein Q8Q08_00965 [Candidatus Omnitrophota bacterium]|nr:hypothetical protein [Candidatus Omnitrophota bacterium]
MKLNLAMIAQLPRADLRRILEADFEDAIIAEARGQGWMVAHFRPARMQDGRWRTPMKGDRGYPDITLVRAGQILMIEAKTEHGSVTKEQAQWLDALGPYGRLFRPRDAKKILEDLK